MTTPHIELTLHGARLQLPDPLGTTSGERVETAQGWSERRLETLELFRRFVYGRATIGRPADLSFETTTFPQQMQGAATRKMVTIRFSGRGGAGAIHLALFIPANHPQPAPCFLFINHLESAVADPTRSIQDDFWPAELLVERGYAVAVFRAADIDPDFEDGFQNGVHGIFDPPLAAGQKRSSDAWGTIAAWAWGASRVMDYLETDADIDASRIALVGHSRGGKTALWAGAQDERFALVVSNNSGCTGAALSRGKKGESVQIINQRFPYWFCANYHRFGGREDELPLDQHQLLSLIAPRLLYITSASEDEWADPTAEYASGVAATPVYELFGLQGLSGELPPIERPLHTGHIGYHLRQGEHDLTRYDWERFVDFTDLHWEH